MVPNVAGSNPVVRPNIKIFKETVTFFESLFLGIIQGITEFLPVSSSAHLKLLKILFNLKELNSCYLFDLFCHLGTMIASVIFLRKEIFKILKEKIEIPFFIIAILPLFPFYFLLKPLVDYLSQTRFLPFCLFFTSIILFVSSCLEKKEIRLTSNKKKLKDMLIIGCMQGLALVPGLSRSGWTISCACLRGWKIQDAVKFSFLLSIPTILGGSVLESIKHLIKNQTSVNLSYNCYITGFLTSFLVGYFAIRYIFSIQTSKKLKPFAWYLLVLAFVSYFCLN